MCFHVALIVFLWAYVCHKTKRAIDGLVWVLQCKDKSFTPIIHWWFWCWVGYTPQWCQAMSWQSDQRQVSPIPAQHQQRPTLSCATCCNYTFSCWSSSHLFPQICHTPPRHQPPYKKLYWTIQHCLAAELRPVSDSLLVNMEFCTTTEDRRMGSNFEKVVDNNRANLCRNKYPRMVGFIGKRTTFL
jgi:hypothetical protein